MAQASICITHPPPLRVQQPRLALDSGLVLRYPVAPSHHRPLLLLYTVVFLHGVPRMGFSSCHLLSLVALPGIVARVNSVALTLQLGPTSEDPRLREIFL